MKKLILFVASVVLVTCLSAQDNLTLTFRGQDQNGAYYQLDSVHVENLTREWSETLIYPDTELILSVTLGIDGYNVWYDFMVYPNPCWGNAYLSKSHMLGGPLRMTVTDVQGRLCAEYSGTVQPGTNVFHITLANPQLYIVRVETAQGVRSQKLLNTSCGDANRIVLVSHYDEESEPGMDYAKKLRFDSEELFVLGDEMRYTGYATIDGEPRVSEIVTQAQLEDDTIGLVFFKDGIPCSNMPTVADHEGNVYPTLQVGPQCWMAANMRATTSPSTGTCIVDMVSSQNTYSGKVARWYNNDSTTYAALNYGLLYNWNAVVDTFNANLGETSLGGTSFTVDFPYAGPRRGICPEGWHVPSNAEWTALVNYVKSKPEYYCGNAATKIAKAFAATTGWESNTTACNVGNDMGSNNALGFTAYPSGFYGNANYSLIAYYAAFWTADQSAAETGHTWGLYCNNPGMYPMSNANKSYCYSVRCLRD